jgi:hypothetical protein
MAAAVGPFGVAVSHDTRFRFFDHSLRHSARSHPSGGTVGLKSVDRPSTGHRPLTAADRSHSRKEAIPASGTGTKVMCLFTGENSNGVQAADFGTFGSTGI